MHVVDEFSKEELEHKSMLELASIILNKDKKALDFHELFDGVAKLKGLTKKAKDDKIGQFYTEINVDGRFMTVGSNVWGLKEWYPVDQHDEQVTSIPEDELEADEELVELGEEEKEMEPIDEDDEVDGVLDEDLEEEEELDPDMELDEDEEDEEI